MYPLHLVGRQWLVFHVGISLHGFFQLQMEKRTPCACPTDYTVWTHGASHCQVFETPVRFRSWQPFCMQSLSRSNSARPRVLPQSHPVALGGGHYPPTKTPLHPPLAPVIPHTPTVHGPPPLLHSWRLEWLRDQAIQRNLPLRTTQRFRPPCRWQEEALAGEVTTRQVLPFTRRDKQWAKVEGLEKTPDSTVAGKTTGAQTRVDQAQVFTWMMRLPRWWWRFLIS